MRLILAAALFAAFTMSAQAQETTTQAPAAVPPSSCAAIVPAPAAPDGATANEAQMREAVAAFEAWRTTEQGTLDCRRAEADALRMQAQARADEYRAAQTDNTARAAAFQEQINIFQARPARSRR
ncbi:MAG: hypothetical protein R3C30_13005 [Hyphomonadaceae bacterium]